MSEYEELITQADIATAHVNWSKRVSDKERRRFWVECFANLVRADEREACAKVCESKLPFQEDYDFQKAAGNTARACAAAIRARGQA